MLNDFLKKSKQFSVSLRFSVLAIFVTLFSLSMFTLIIITHVYFIETITNISFDLMKQASETAFNQIQHETKNAEIKSKAAAQLIKSQVVDPNDTKELISYTVSIMQHEIKLLPNVQAIIWGDISGNMIMAERTENNTVRSEIIQRSITPPIHKIIDYDANGNITHSTHSTDFSYDPRTRPWYIAAKSTKKTTWTDIYHYRLSSYLGTSVATPVFNNSGALSGILNFNIRVDYIRHMLENIYLSKHGILFITTNDGKLVAFPQLEQYKNAALTDIHTLTTTPWVSLSFDLHQKNNAKEFTFSYQGKDYLATYELLSKFGSSSWWIGAVVPIEDFTNELQKTHFLTSIISIIILIFGIVLVSILTSRVVHPLKKITQEIRKIRDFDLSGEKPVSSHIKEISYIANALYSMKQGLRTFQKYVPSTLVRQLIETGEDARIGGIKKPLAVLFSDIQDFTTLAEQIDATEITTHLCDYFNELSKIIVVNHGTIDKYIGDSIMAFWGAPLDSNTPAKDAAKAALQCIHRSNELNKQWQAANKPIFYTRIGIHLGEALVGNLGSSERLNYTAIGDASNTANRLEKINKMYGTQIIVSDSIYQTIKNNFILRMIDFISIKGKNNSHYIYELIAETRDELTYDLENYTLVFNKGFTAYQQDLWGTAIEFFTECIRIYPADTVAPVFIKRCLLASKNSN